MIAHDTFEGYRLTFTPRGYTISNMNHLPVSSPNPAISLLTIEERNTLEDELERDIRSIELHVGKLPSAQGQTAFYGSSTIRLWESIQAELSPLPVVNLGFGGASYDYGVAYFERVFKSIQPEHVVLYFGDNDIARGQTPREILTQLRRLLELLETRFSALKISAISVKPSPIRTPLLDLAFETNTHIKAEMAAKPHRRYIDIVDHFLDRDGAPDTSLYVEDMLHFNDLGYQTWSRELRRALLSDGSL